MLSINGNPTIGSRRMLSGRGDLVVEHHHQPRPSAAAAAADLHGMPEVDLSVHRIPESIS